MTNPLHLPQSFGLLRQRTREAYASAKSRSQGRYAEVLRNFVASAVFVYPGLGVYLIWLACVGFPTIRWFSVKTREVPHSHFQPAPLL